MRSEEDELIKQFNSFPTRKNLSTEKYIVSDSILESFDPLYNVKNAESTIIDESLPSFANYNQNVNETLIYEEKVDPNESGETNATANYYSCEQDSLCLDENNITQILDMYGEQIDADKARYNVATPRSKLKTHSAYNMDAEIGKTVNLSDHDSGDKKPNMNESDDASQKDTLNTLNLYLNVIELMKKQNKKLEEKYEELLKKARAENDNLKTDYASLDTSFSELYGRYEKLRQMNADLRNNEKVLIEQRDQQNDLLTVADERIDQLAYAADTKLKEANEEIYNMKKKHENELSLLHTSLKLEQSKNQDLEMSLKHKISQNEELTAICDELLKHANM